MENILLGEEKELIEKLKEIRQKKSQEYLQKYIELCKEYGLCIKTQVSQTGSILEHFDRVQDISQIAL